MPMLLSEQETKARLMTLDLFEVYVPRRKNREVLFGDLFTLGYHTMVLMETGLAFSRIINTGGSMESLTE